MIFVTGAISTFIYLQFYFRHFLLFISVIMIYDCLMSCISACIFSSSPTTTPRAQLRQLHSTLNQTPFCRFFPFTINRAVVCPYGWILIPSASSTGKDKIIQPNCWRFAFNRKDVEWKIIGYIYSASTNCHIPFAAIALIFGIDRFMSEGRALTNIIGNTVATIVVAKWEKEIDLSTSKKLIGW